MQHAPLTAVHRAEYLPPAFLIDSVTLHFSLDPTATTVSSRLAFRRNPAHGDASAPLRLDGEALTLVALSLDGHDLGAQRVSVRAARPHHR